MKQNGTNGTMWRTKTIKTENHVEEDFDISSKYVFGTSRRVLYHIK
jgi:hypothetical protein